ncbi:MAG TPA: endonuclease/exonuclease/phosphatase family protein [Kofleriaceae bacterium]|nr:endonuclease/exonuclease/phosphatase family protein [Kofleriaceae bacterium]
MRAAAWNLREFPASAQTVAEVAGALERLLLDLVAVAEVKDAAAFAELVAARPGWAGEVSAAPSVPDGARQALMWRTAKVAVTAIQPLFTSEPTLFPRPPLRATVTVAGTPARTFTIFALHLKAGIAASDEATRVAAAARVEAEVRAFVDGPEADEVLIIGDFNEEPGDPRYAEVFAPFSADRYRVLSAALAASGAVTFLPASVMLDHVVGTVALDDEVGGPAEIPALEAQIADYSNAVSDHLPIVQPLSF